MDPARAFLRHTLAALAYRAAKPLRDAPPGFADFADGKGGRTPRQLVAHMGDLFDWALLRRQAGAAIKGENYFRADVVAGRIGLVQTPPVREF